MPPFVVQISLRSKAVFGYILGFERRFYIVVKFGVTHVWYARGRTGFGVTRMMLEKAMERLREAA